MMASQNVIDAARRTARHHDQQMGLSVRRRAALTTATSEPLALTTSANIAIGATSAPISAPVGMVGALPAGLSVTIGAHTTTLAARFEPSGSATTGTLALTTGPLALIPSGAAVTWSAYVTIDLSAAWAQPITVKQDWQRMLGLGQESMALEVTAAEGMPDLKFDDQVFSAGVDFGRVLVVNELVAGLEVMLLQ